MAAEVIQVDANKPAAESLDVAARFLRQGGLVAFPTETVYGLGASALDGAAVGKIFAAKGRPASNPVIVHVGLVGELFPLVDDMPPLAEQLSKAFWPGGLTLVLNKAPFVPPEVTAGGDTVAVRIPSHPVALALLQYFGGPIAAPSANRSNRLSPTCAEHVLADLADEVDVVLDGGPCPGGVESTVLDISTCTTGGGPKILRPGLVSAEEIARVIGVPVESLIPDGKQHGVHRSPGQLKKHYSPATPLSLFESESFNPSGLQAGEVVLSFGALPLGLPDEVRHVTLPPDVEHATQEFYAMLHRLDGENHRRMVVVLPPDEPRWWALRDRLKRGAAED